MGSIFSLVVWLFILLFLWVGKQTEKENQKLIAQGINPDFNILKNPSSGEFKLDLCPTLGPKYYVRLIEETRNNYITREYGGHHKIRRWSKTTHYYFESLEQAKSNLSIVDGKLAKQYEYNYSFDKRWYIDATSIVGGPYAGRTFPNFEETDYKY